MFRRLYEWILRLSASRFATPVLFFLAFGESFILPIPPDAMLAPMILAKPDRAWQGAAVCAAGSVLGGLVGYYIGYALEPTAHWILAATGHAGAESQIQAAYAKWGLGVVMLGIAPLVPFPIITLSSGLAHFSFWQFALVSAFARTARFFAVTAIIKRLGPAAVLMLERRLLTVGLGLLGLVVLVVLAVNFRGHGLGW